MKRFNYFLSLIAGLFIFAGSMVMNAQTAVCSFAKRGVDTEVSRGDRARYPSFTYCYKPLSEKPIDVFYYVPTTGNPKEMPVLFVLSGAQRVGNGELNPWQPFAEKYGFIVINPQFTKELYSGNEYQFGNVAATKEDRVKIMRGEKGKLNSKKKWIYSIVEELFDYYKKTTGSKVEGYYLFGHSAGGQFVHRMVLLLPNARYIKAVAANPSAWTWADEKGMVADDGTVYGWPYSVKGTPSGNKKTLTKVLQKKLYIQIGTKDIETRALDVSAGANAQGPRRYHRALRFYDACVEKAKELGIDLGFELAVVEGTRHSTLQAVYGYPNPDKEKIEESELGVNSAFLLLFRRD